MTEHVDQLKEDFPCSLERDNEAWNDKMFQVDNRSKILDEEKSEAVNAFSVKFIFTQEMQARRKAWSWIIHRTRPQVSQ